MKRREDQVEKNCWYVVVVDWQRKTTATFFSLEKEVCLYLTETVEWIRVDTNLN